MSCYLSLLSFLASQRFNGPLSQSLPFRFTSLQKVLSLFFEKLDGVIPPAENRKYYLKYLSFTCAELLELPFNEESSFPTAEPYD